MLMVLDHNINSTTVKIYCGRCKRDSIVEITPKNILGDLSKYNSSILMDLIVSIDLELRSRSRSTNDNIQKYRAILLD